MRTNILQFKGRYDQHRPFSCPARGGREDTDRSTRAAFCLHAHQIATRAEEAAVRAAGLEWRDYDRFMQKYVQTHQRSSALARYPGDLDTKPLSR